MTYCNEGPSVDPNAWPMGLPIPMLTPEEMLANLAFITFNLSQKSKFELARAYAADVRKRKGMVVRRIA